MRLVSPFFLEHDVEGTLYSAYLHHATPLAQCHYWRPAGTPAKICLNCAMTGFPIFRILLSLFASVDYCTMYN